MSGGFWQPAFSLGQWWAFAALAAIPPLILLLYFLKLKRQPLEVPSTYLWTKAIEDLHVNSIWQRLRQSLLLFLQLLLIALVALALFRPGWRGESLEGSRFIFLIDTSASMSAIDIEPSRLEAAKKFVRSQIDKLKSGDSAMIVSFSDTVRVEQPFTTNTRQLHARLNGIEPTNRTSELGEALRTAAGLANPGRQSFEKTDVQVADAIDATMYIVSDGKFDRVPDFSYASNLTIEYIKIGDDVIDNLAVVAFSSDRNPEDPTALQAFARIENFGDAPQTAEVSLYLNDKLADAQKVTIPQLALVDGIRRPGGMGAQFDLPADFEGDLRIEIDRKDQLSVDNVAYATLNAPRPARVLYVTAGLGEAYKLALDTGVMRKIANVVTMTPADLEKEQTMVDLATGTFDLVIFEDCQPKEMPQANTLFIGQVPKAEGWAVEDTIIQPQIIQIDPSHPLTQLIDMSDVVIVESKLLKAPQGAKSLFDEANGPIYAIAPRGSYEDAVIGFGVLRADENGAPTPNTNWPRRRSFPVFIMNAVKYLGGVGGAVSSMPSVRPGTQQQLRTLFPVPEITVTTPKKETLRLKREGTAFFPFTQTEEIGAYEVREGTGEKLSYKFCVNLFSSSESDLVPAEKLEIGNQETKANKGASKSDLRRELWKPILLLGLAVLMIEWYIYNKRVYL